MFYLELLVTSAYGVALTCTRQRFFAVEISGLFMKLATIDSLP